MEVEVNKRIKFKGKYYNKGEYVTIPTGLLKDFEERGLINLNSIDKENIQDTIEDDLAEEDKRRDTQASNTKGQESKREGSKEEIVDNKGETVKKDEIIDRLEELGIEHNKNNKKIELFKLIPEEERDLWEIIQKS